MSLPPFRLLIVEDMDELYEYYERILTQLLPKDRIEMVRAATIASALEVIKDPWGAILMDYALGEAAHIDDSPIRNGADLVKVRRAVEAGDDGCGGTERALILGISSSTVTNEFIIKEGADASMLKHQVPEMAKEIERRL